MSHGALPADFLDNCVSVREVGGQLQALDRIGYVTVTPDPWRMAPGDKRPGARYLVYYEGGRLIGQVSRHSQPTHTRFRNGHQHFCGYRMYWQAETADPIAELVATNLDTRNMAAASLLKRYMSRPGHERSVIAQTEDETETRSLQRR